MQSFFCSAVLNLHSCSTNTNTLLLIRLPWKLTVAEWTTAGDKLNRVVGTTQQSEL